MEVEKVAMDVIAHAIPALQRTVSTQFYMKKTLKFGVIFSLLALLSSVAQTVYGQSLITDEGAIGGGQVGPLTRQNVHASAISSGTYKVRTAWVKGPRKDSPEYQSWAENMVLQMEKTNFWAVFGLTTLDLDNISKSTTDIADQVIWLVGQVQGLDGSKISLDMWQFVQTSSDPEHALNDIYTTVGKDFVYNSTARGVLIGSGGSVTVLNGQAGSTPADWINFIGKQGKSFTYTTEQDLMNRIWPYYISIPDFGVTGTLNIIGSGGNILASASTDIHSTAIRLAIKIADKDNLLITFLGVGSGTPIILESASSPLGPWDGKKVFDQSFVVERKPTKSTFFRARTVTP